MDPANAPEAPVIAQEAPPAAQDYVSIDWHAVRMLALAVGVRESARRLGISEPMVRKRCEREGWLRDPNARELAKRSVQERTQPMVSRHLSPAALLAEEMAGLGAQSKLGMARSVAKVAQAMEAMDGQTLFRDSQNVKNSIQSAAILHSWDKTSGGSRIRLELLGTKGESMAIDVESEVVTDQDWSE